MAIARGAIGDFAMTAIDSIEETFVERGIDPDRLTTGAMMLIVEIDREADPEEAGDLPATHVLYYCSDERAWAQAGLLRAAVLTAEDKP